jgi:hypothetical protein
MTSGISFSCKETSILVTPLLGSVNNRIDSLIPVLIAVIRKTPYKVTYSLDGKNIKFYAILPGTLDETGDVIESLKRVPGVSSKSIQCTQLFDSDHKDSQYLDGFPKVTGEFADVLLPHNRCSTVIDTPFGEKIRHRHLAYSAMCEEETLVVVPMEHVICFTDEILKTVRISVNLHFKGNVLQPIQIYGLDGTFKNILFDIK